jgi:hypothetical protein
VPTNLYLIHLRLLRGDTVFPALEDVLGPIGAAIADSSRHIDEACATKDEEWFEAVTDEECEVIEELLGTSLVVCQAYITSVVSRVLGILRFADRRGHTLKSVAPKRDHIVSATSTYCGNTGFTNIQVMDAFANYFKHRFEWSSDWSKAGGPAARTITIVRAAGASEGSSGNLRTGAEVLGNSDYSDLSVFSEILETWRAGLEATVRAELASLGCL